MLLIIFNEVCPDVVHNAQKTSLGTIAFSSFQQYSSLFFWFSVYYVWLILILTISVPVAYSLLLVMYKKIVPMIGFSRN